MNFPTQIQSRTARKWLHELGFQPYSHKKDIFIDGHERDDVKGYFYVNLRSLHLPPPLPADGKSTHQISNPEATY